ncbi:MAG: peptidylprolyl isomerase [Cyclobacteriaceae bacterium]|nr:peptidylprolyl isomerase [Cyclobacteriaceae bacterium]
MEKIQMVWLILFSGVLVFQGCDNKKQDYLFTIRTKLGDMKMVLYDQTPVHKKNFIKLTEKGFYDSLIFHRVINGFMIQSGNPESKGSMPNGRLGNGGPGYNLPSEFITDIIHEKGAVAAARQGDNQNPKKESSGSQFYIVQGKIWTEKELRDSRINFDELYKYFENLIERASYKHVQDRVRVLQHEQKVEDLQDLIISMKDTIEMEYDVELDLPLTEQQIETYTTVGGTPHLDGSYTVFGKVIDGLEIIDKIASVPTGPNDRPAENIILTIEMEKMDRDRIEELYDFQYPDISAD